MENKGALSTVLSLVITGQPLGWGHPVLAEADSGSSVKTLTLATDKAKHLVRGLIRVPCSTPGTSLAATGTWAQPHS